MSKSSREKYRFTLMNNNTAFETLVQDNGTIQYTKENAIFNETHFSSQNISSLLSTLELNLFGEITNTTEFEVTYLNSELLKDLTTKSYFEQSTTNNSTNRSYVSHSRSAYDSKGAAYYICSVIIVYALAIVLLIVSLARRKKKDQYRPANQRSNSEEYYIKIRDLEKSINGARRLSHGRSLTNNLNETASCSDTSTKDMINFKCDWSLNEQVTYSVQSMRQQDVYKMNPTFKANSFNSITKHSEYLKSPKLFCHNSDSKEEIITLVQVIDDTKQSPPITPPIEYAGLKQKLKIHSKSLEETHNFRHQQGIKKCSSSRSVKNKCRWSMGPDGNIWILQLDNSSSESEKSHKVAHNQYSDRNVGHQNKFTEPNRQLQISNLLDSVSSPNKLSTKVLLGQEARNISSQPAQEPLWQYRDKYVEKRKYPPKRELSENMFEKYETSPMKHHSKIQNYKTSTTPLQFRCQSNQPKYYDTKYNDDLKCFTANKTTVSNGYSNGTLPYRQENGRHNLNFANETRHFKNGNKVCRNSTPQKTNIQKLIHVTSV
ncbi:hypothetical protein HELRODRAFT_171423 [Helobdella robusta]|uniref:Uncharacterized protein n=1 Tax=Helobdella robusta TaxID=6412 RepID=T1F494_HELRO|nr:hypothetical protein HELRODRAFT_171423 [Helobdella robusta]ESO05755.1 hypothetical protein HELRODRAFT_171423 [Helobdella robusta]